MNWTKLRIRKNKHFTGRKLLFSWLSALLVTIIWLGMPVASAPAVLGGIRYQQQITPTVDSTPLSPTLSPEDLDAAAPDLLRIIPLLEPLAPEQIQSEIYGQPDCEVSTNAQYERDLFELVNDERERLGLNLLEWDDDLAEAARKHSADMACNDYFSHDSLDGTTFDTRISAEGYVFTAAGENLYAGGGIFDNPKQAFTGWFNSADHYMVMTHPDLTEVGIGYIYAADSRYKGYFSADFGTPE